MVEKRVPKAAPKNIISARITKMHIPERQVPMIAQIYPALRFLLEPTEYWEGLFLYNALAFEPNTRAIIPSIIPGNP